MSGGVVTDKRYIRSVRKTSCFDANERARSKGWEELTGRAYTQKSNIAIVLDNMCIRQEYLADQCGRSEISGSFDVTETKDLANVLRAGKLPASADIVQSEVSILRSEAIDNGTNSAIVGLLLVSLWMMVYYGKAGWYANIALAVNLLFLLEFWQV
jgi:SecD/SecF fusion protein